MVVKEILFICQLKELYVRITLTSRIRSWNTGIQVDITRVTPQNRTTSALSPQLNTINVPQTAILCEARQKQMHLLTTKLNLAKIDFTGKKYTCSRAG